MEPLPGADPGIPSVPGTSAHWREGQGWPGWNRTSVVTWFKAMAPLPTEQPANGPTARCHPGLAVATRDARTLVPVAWCARRDSNPQHPASRAGLSASVGVRAHGAATRCRTGPPALRGPGRKPCAVAELPGLESNQVRHRLVTLDSNQEIPRVRAGWVCQFPQ